MLSSVTDLKPLDTPDSPYYYTFKVQCTSCREVHANWVGINRHVGALQAKSNPFANPNSPSLLGSHGFHSSQYKL